MAKTSSSVTNFPFDPSSNSISDPANPLINTESPCFTVLHSAPTEATDPQMDDPGPAFSDELINKIPPAVVDSSESGITDNRFPVAFIFSGIKPADAPTRDKETLLLFFRWLRAKCAVSEPLNSGFWLDKVNMLRFK